MPGFKIAILKNVYEKIMFWVNHADFEVSGFGTVTYDEKAQIFTVEDAFLLKQEGGSAHTDLDATALAQLQYEVHRNKPKGELRFWWHSHVNMATFWSQQDKDTIKQLGSEGWIVATVFNKKAEMKSAFCAQNNITLVGRGTYMEDDLKTEIPDYYDQNLITQWTKDFDDKVKKKTYELPKKFNKKDFDKYEEYYGHYDYEAQKWVEGTKKKENGIILDSRSLSDPSLRAEANILKLSPKAWLDILNGTDEPAVERCYLILDAHYDEAISEKMKMKAAMS